MSLHRSSLIRRLLWLAALTPMLVFAYLGHFSRLMSDDYCAIAVGQELGAWEGMTYWYDSWAGSYANFFFKSAIAPLDTAAPVITPALILVLCWLATAFLLSQVLEGIGIAASRPELPLLLGAAVVVASVNALHSPQSFYWFAASTHYTLPLALLTAYLGLFLRAMRAGTRLVLLGHGLLGAALCFVSGGASEIFVVFQLVFLSLCGLPLFAARRSCGWRKSSTVLGAGWLATALATLLQLGSPGLAKRAAYDAELFGHALRTPIDLIRGTIELTVEHLGHPPLFAGFLWLLAFAMFVTLISHRRGAALSADATPLPALRPLAAGFAFQLLWLPLLWVHTSDDPQFFGRFSSGFLVVILLNALLIVGFALLIRQRRRQRDRRPEHGNDSSRAVIFWLAAMLALFVLTQLRGIHFRAAAYLFITAVSLLVILGQRLSTTNEDPLTRRLWQYAHYALAVSVISLAAIVFAALFGRGFVDERILAPAVFLLVVPGIFWGAYLGRAFAYRFSFAEGNPVPLRILKAGCLVVILVMTFGMTLGQARLIAPFQAFAREWDLRHQEILMQKRSGLSEIEVAPLSFDLADYLRLVRLERDPANRCALRYYGVDAILVRDR